MLKREIYKRLMLWKNSDHKKALCIIGARQIGKTTIIREFAKNNYESFCEINFYEMPLAKKIFDGSLDANTIIMQLSALTKNSFIPGKTLIFFDEIQMCPNARCAIKFLVEDGRFDYISSGSLLGVNINDIPSIPVGFEETINMYPMNFKEFAIANGINEDTISYLEKCYVNLREVKDTIHLMMQKLFYAYIIVGGMPEAVQIFIDTHDITKVISYQNMILEKYRLDISQYATNSEKIKIKNIFDAVPSMLNQKNRRFRINSVDKNARLLRYEDSFNWLNDAGVTLSCYNVVAPIMPLGLNSKRNLFKMYLADTGLLCAACMDDIQFGILNGDLSINMGSILENVMAQELKNNGFDLYYYDSNKNGEIDFLVNYNQKIIPIEIKSGNDYKQHKALDKIMTIDEYNLNGAIVFSKSNIEKKDSVIYLPWYMIMFFKNKKIESLIYNVEINNIN